MKKKKQPQQQKKNTYMQQVWCFVLLFLAAVILSLIIALIITRVLTPPVEDKLPGNFRNGFLLPQHIRAIKKIALVGNGPLSSQDISEIQRDFHHVVGFNDMRRRDIGANIAVVRNKLLGMPLARTVPLSVKDILFLGSMRQKRVDKMKKDNPHARVHVLYGPDRDLMTTLFPGEPTNTVSKLSTGISALREFVRNLAKDAEIHLYGMNWAFPTAHNGRLERRYAEQQSNVTIHPVSNGKKYHADRSSE